MKKSTALIYLVIVTIVSIYVIGTNDDIYDISMANVNMQLQNCSLQIVDMQKYTDDMQKYIDNNIR